jgi:hypothetical protein
MSLAVERTAAFNTGRRTAAALNEAALLRDVLVREIRALGALYVVGKRKPITELPPEKQQQVRQAYEGTLWASDYGIEIICTCTSERLANEICALRGPNYFVARTPIDSPLPDETTVGDYPCMFPGSDAKELYENLEAATLPMPVSQVRALEDEIRRLRKQLDDVRGT